MNRNKPSHSPCGRGPETAPPTPEGLFTGPPDFVGIGAQRCGTSWWYTLISSHPKVFVPKHMLGLVSKNYMVKERHFFDNFFIADFNDEHVRAYHRWFPRPEDAITGEWTPRYAVDYWAPPLLARAAHEARLMMMLRDPVERYVSGMTHFRRYGKLSNDLALCHLQRGLYHRQLSWWLEHFPRERFLVLQYEKCVADPAGELRRTFRFLGLDDGPRFSKQRLTTPVNPRGHIRPYPLTEHHRRSLVAQLESDVFQLAKDFPEIDLSLWSNFRRD